MTATVLLDRLQGVRLTGPGIWRARCPAHEGKSLSLSVREGEQGRTLVHCFAGCDVAEVLTAVGLTVSQLFSERSPEHRHSPSRMRMPATEALALLDHEVLVASLILRDILAEKRVDADQWQRLSLASTRISDARTYSCPARVPRESARAS
ncbi:hypothetical protein [Povalibacter sp.]|uniref:hypothetical protein n=1 Tax=Povalibacter sp. TaxID=1962978 RepID=UPI002F401492